MKGSCGSREILARLVLYTITHRTILGIQKGGNRILPEVKIGIPLVYSVNVRLFEDLLTKECR